MKKKLNKKFLSFILILVFVFLSIYYEDSTDSTSSNIQKKMEEDTNQVINIDKNSILSVSFIDVGQADSILIENEGEYALIDAGNNADGEKLVTYFKTLGITTFTHLIGTHAHEDHIGGLDDIIDNFNIKNFYMPDTVHTTKTFEDVLTSLEKKQIGLNIPNIDDEFNIGNAKITVLNIDQDSSDLNDSSIVLKLTYGTNSFLLMGDATAKVEKNLLNKDIKSDVLKIGHHGSQYSSSTEFLDKVIPQFAVISAGENNTYDHPHPSTISRLENRNIKIYRTDEAGTIVAKSNGTIINFESIKTDTNG